MKQDDNLSIAPPSSGDMAVIGEGTPNRTPISIQVLQNIYHELTGKSEEVSKSYDEAFHVVLNDFKQLNHRVQQICEQYSICSSNSNITVFYINDTKDTYSSFARFEAFNSGSSSAVESVLLTYNFLIILPKVSQPQSYTVTIRIASPVTIQRKMNENMFDVPKIFRLMGGPRTAVVSIKYVDYAVARTVLNTIDEWFNALPQSRSGKGWNLLRKHTDYIPIITKYLADLTVAGVIVANVEHFLSPTSTLVDLARFGILSFAGIFAAYKIAYHLGSAAEDTLDNWVDLAYVSITDGDRKEVELAKSRNKGALLFGALKLVSALMVSVAAKFIVYRLTGVI